MSKNKKKVFHIIGSMEIIAGTENFLIKLLNNNEKFNNYLILLSRKKNLKKKLKQRIKIKIFDLTNPITFINNLSNLLIFLKKESPSVVFTWLYHSNLLSFFIRLIDKKIKIFWNIRHSNINKLVSFKSYFSFTLSKIISNITPTKIIYNSDCAKKIHEKSGYSKKKSIIITNGVKKNIMMKNKNRKKIYLGMASRWHKDKNHEMLFKSLNKLKNVNFSLILCGNFINYNNKKLVNLLKKYQIKDYLLLDKIDNIKKYFKKIDINLLSSDTESFPNIIIESMSYGIPSVSTDVGDVRKIMNETGKVVKKNDANQFTKALMSLVEEKKNKFQKWRNRREKCYLVAQQKFNIKQTINNFEKLV